MSSRTVFCPYSMPSISESDRARCLVGPGQAKVSSFLAKKNTAGGRHWLHFGASYFGRINPRRFDTVASGEWLAQCPRCAISFGPGGNDRSQKQSCISEGRE